jgi:vacuolar protein sorting-associated protein 53
MHNDELPPELLLAIQNVLNTQSTQERDPLEDISNNFDAAKILNGYFPDGASIPTVAY